MDGLKAETRRQEEVSPSTSRVYSAFSDPCLSFLPPPIALRHDKARPYSLALALFLSPPATSASRPATMPAHDEKLNGSPEEHVQMLEVHEKDQGDLLPSPVSATASGSKQQPKLSATMIIPVWIALSSAVIIYNNYLYNTLQFRFPVFLVTWHLIFAVSLRSLLSSIFSQFSAPASTQLS